MLWSTSELIASFCWTTIAHPTQRDWFWLDWFQPRRQVCCVRGWLGSRCVQSRLGIHDSINVTRMLPWPTNASDFTSIECLKSSEVLNEMEYYSHWHKWRHHSLPAVGVESHGPMLCSSDERALWGIEQGLSLYVAHGVNTISQINLSDCDNPQFSLIDMWRFYTSWHHNRAVLHRVFMVIIRSVIFETQRCLTWKRLT